MNNTQELWQLYKDDCNPLPGQGASKDEVYTKGLLHGAAHVWIWRQGKSGKQVLVQKRSATKRTYANMLDISAAGHIDLGETPIQAAIRETEEEIGLIIKEDDLVPIGKLHINISDSSGNIENELRWLYTLQTSQSDFNLQVDEVGSVQWMDLADFKNEVLPNKGNFVPQGEKYFALLLGNL